MEKELEYCKQLISNIKESKNICSYPKVQEKLNLLEEAVRDDLEHLETSKDGDVKIGHKTAESSFFGYKTHIAMTKERIITAATITSGEKADGKELAALVQKSRGTGVEVETVIGDKAYSSKENIDAAKDGNYELVTRLNSIVTQGNRTKPDDFKFNKDVGMYQCKAGHLVIHKYLDKPKTEDKNPRMTYFFDIEICKKCPYRDRCYKEGAKKKTYAETVICDSHSEQAQFQETEHFKEKAKERYKIEAKNSELKHRNGYDVASSSGLIGMEMQGAMAIFAVNLKRIIKVMSEK
ncbi:DDE transposase [Lacrimispora brassicae]